jgi:hypothetical protein
MLLLFLPLALFLPGYVIVCSFTNRQTVSVDLPTLDGIETIETIETIEAVFLSLILSVSLTGLTALGLAQAGYFSLPALLGIVVLISLSIVGMELQRGHSLSWRVSSSARTDWLALVTLSILAALLFLHPHQFILGAADAGVYVNLGANLDRTGALLIREALLTELTPGLLPGLLREQLPGATTRFIRLPGFYLSDATSGLVIPQFYPLHPVWLSIGHSLLGIIGGLFVTPVWGILGVLVVYLYGRSLFSGGTGGLAAMLLAITPLQVYFARYPTAEPLTQFFTWTFLWAFTAFALGRAPRGLWGLVAGLAFGQVFLARIDALPMLLVPMIWFALLIIRRHQRPGERRFWIPLLALTAYAAFHGLFFSRPYTLDLYGWILPFVWKQLLIMMPLIAIASALFIWWFRIRPQLRPSFLARRDWTPLLRHMMALALVALALYAYFIRPRTGTATLADYWYSSSEFPITNHENLIRLGWYLSPLGIALAVFGCVIFILQDRWAKLWPLWTVGGGFSILYLYNIFNNPFHIYAMRRYVPVVVPFFMLAAARALAWLWQHRAKVSRLASVVLLSLLSVWLIYNGRLVWGQVEYRGAIAQVEQIANHFEDRAIILFIDNSSLGLGSILGTPLQFLHQLTVFDLQEKELDIALLEQQVAEWLAEDRPVYVAQDATASIEFLNQCCVPAGTINLDVAQLETSYTHVPTKVDQVRYGAKVYRIDKTCALAP